MIERYRDHAANERTFLAWIRTGITVMMLGFLVEKFELFLGALGQKVPAHSATPATTPGIQVITVALVVLGLLIIGTATVRFLGIHKAIEEPDTFRFRGTRFSLLLAILLLSFGLYLLLYLTRLI